MPISARDAKKYIQPGETRHQGCKYPDGQNVLLVNRLIGGVAELAYQEFKDSVDDKIATHLVSNQPRPAKTGTQKRSTSEPRSNRPLKKARTMLYRPCLLPPQWPGSNHHHHPDSARLR